MLIPSRVVALAFGFAMLVAGAASASIYRVSFDGTVIDGFDASGVFGDPASLTGQRFTATYVYDTNSGFRSLDPGVSDYIEPVNVTLRIKGFTYAFPTHNRIWSYATAQPGQLHFAQLTAVDADPVDLQSIDNTAFSGWFQPNLDPGTTAVIAAQGGGGFGISICCCPSCGDQFTDVSAGGTFALDSVRFAIPEPSSWVLMISGFGLSGAVLRRRRPAVA